jgi:hypothetical protein
MHQLSISIGLEVRRRLDIAACDTAEVADLVAPLKKSAKTQRYKFQIVFWPSGFGAMMFCLNIAFDGQPLWQLGAVASLLTAPAYGLNGHGSNHNKPKKENPQRVTTQPLSMVQRSYRLPKAKLSKSQLSLPRMSRLAVLRLMKANEKGSSISY